MAGENNRWQKLKSASIVHAEELLREAENDYVSACGRFLSRHPSKDYTWALCKENAFVSAMIINSKSTLLPVLREEKEIPDARFLKNFLKKKKPHSVQGLMWEVQIMENVLERIGMTACEIFDYDLMNLDNPPSAIKSSGPENLVLSVPQMIDLDAVAPLQSGYEMEEVLPKGAAFSPAASRINLSNIIAKGQILAAQINGRLVGKINVSSVSFTRYLVGGVYVHPDFRGMGIAKRMTQRFTASLISQGMGVTLFVKKNNVPARKIYADLGFKKTGDYRITYY
jgi:predicted GNAT family acetyltransferase